MSISNRPASGINQGKRSMEQIARLMESQNLPQNRLGIPDEEMHKRYTKGYDLHLAERYAEAAHEFAELTALNPAVKEYWFALAMTQIRCAHYELALTSLAMASVLDADDPEPHFYAGLCHLSLEKAPEAQLALDLACQIADTQPKYSDLILEAREWMEELKP